MREVRPFLDAESLGAPETMPELSSKQVGYAVEVEGGERGARSREAGEQVTRVYAWFVSSLVYLSIGFAAALWDAGGPGPLRKAWLVAAVGVPLIVPMLWAVALWVWWCLAPRLRAPALPNRPRVSRYDSPRSPTPRPFLLARGTRR